MGRDARLETAVDDLTAAVVLSTAEVAPLQAAIEGVDAAIDLATAELAPLQIAIENVDAAVAVGASGTLLTTTAKAAGRVRTTAGGIAVLNLTDVSGASTSLMGVRIKAADSFRTLTAQFA